LLVSVFEAQVARYPDRLAVVSDDGRLTYRELNQAANRMARVVRERLGDGEATVALLFPPSASMVAAILAVLKAGKIYVALDPSDPVPRTAYMLDDCEARLVLTGTRLLSFAPQVAKGGQDVVSCDDIDPSTAVANQGCVVSGTTGAFLLYTSGSTGNPKGVLHNHRNVLVEIRNYTDDVRIGPEDRLAVWHSFSFANSIRNLYGALLNGAAVFPYDLPGGGLMPLAAWIRSHEISMIHTLATTFRAFVDVLPRDETLSSVRVLRLGGGVHHQRGCREVQASFPPFVCAHACHGADGDFQHPASAHRSRLERRRGQGAGGLPGGRQGGAPPRRGGAAGRTGRARRDRRAQQVPRGGYWRQPGLTRAAF
jgi:non-ribosomal peptide synthetase component F